MPPPNNINRSSVDPRKVASRCVPLLFTPSSSCPAVFAAAVTKLHRSPFLPAGRLALEAVFGWIGTDQDCSLGCLHTVHLGGGGEGGEWGVEEAVRRLGELPALQRLQVVCARWGRGGWKEGIGGEGW